MFHILLSLPRECLKGARMDLQRGREPLKARIWSMHDKDHLSQETIDVQTLLAAVCRHAVLRLGAFLKGSQSSSSQASDLDPGHRPV